MNDERYQVLFDAWSESRLTPAEATELSALLRSAPQALARFRTDGAFHGQLHAALDALNLDQASTPSNPIAFPSRGRALGIAAMLLGGGLTVASLGWMLSARAEHAESRPLGIRDGGFDALKGRVPDGFPSDIFTWGGDPSEITSAQGHPTALRFLEAAGEPNIPNSPRQSCDVFQIIDLKSVRDQLLSSSEAYVELQANLLDERKSPATPVRFIAKVYVFEGSPQELARSWPPQQDQVLASGAQFRISSGEKSNEWKSLTTRCVLPPTAGFLVVHIGAGSAGQPGEAAPKLGEQYADDVRLTLRTRQNKTELAAR
ncbi:MAG: hypothetical protein ORN22_01530 [Opitutales bacterium]|nr:hypothetical protein [Opitutales bacterium]